MSGPLGPKSVDWLDAHNALGVDVVRERLDEAAFMATTAEEEAARAAAGAEGGRPGAAPTGGKGEGGRGESKSVVESDEDADIYPENPAHAASLFLCEMFAPDDPHRATGATWRLVTWNGQFYVWSGGRWSAWGDDVVRSIARDWANTKKVWKKGEYEDYVPTDRSLSELLSAVRDLTCVVTDGMGKWLARAYFDDGVPGYRVHAPSRVLDDEARAAEGLPDPAKLLVMQNGYMHTGDIAAGRAELTPPTERLFAADPIPHPWPASATEAIRAGTVEAWYQEHCPGWIAHLEWIDDGREWFSRGLLRHFGRAMISDLLPAQVPVLVGAKGGGKGTTLEPMIAVFGNAALGGMTMDSLVVPSRLKMLIGKRLVGFPDDEVTGPNKLAIGAELKKASEGGEMLADPKYKDAIAFKNTALPVIVCNRMPNLRDPGGALASRLRFYEFRKGVRGTAAEDTGVKERILGEVPSIMVHTVWEGLRPYLVDKVAGHNALPKPDGHEHLDRLFVDQADTMGAFVDDCLVCNKSTDVVGVPTGEMPSIWVGVLHELYKAWAARSGKDDHIPSLSKFAQDLHAAVVGWGLPPSRGKVLRDDAGRTVGSRPSHWFGIRLRDGVLAELYDGPNDPRLPKFGVHPNGDLDYAAHQACLDVEARRLDDGPAASPPPYSGFLAPEQGVPDA